MDAAVDEKEHAHRHHGQENAAQEHLLPLGKGVGAEGHARHGQEDGPDGGGDEPDEALVKGVALLLGVKVRYHGVGFGKAVVLHPACHQNHHRGRHDEHHRPGGEVLRQGEALLQTRQGRAQDDGAHRPGGLQGKAGHEPVIAHRVLGQGALHAPPHQGVHIRMEDAAELQNGIHLRIAGPGLPLGDRLAADVQQFGQLLLGHAGAGAEKLQVV